VRASSPILQAFTASLMSPNFTFLDPCRPDVARLVAAMVQARDAAERRSWSHPQEPTGEEWWADVLADPRARKRERRRTDLAVRQAFYRLADEKREIILVACSKCDWRAAFSRDDLIATHGAHYAMPNLLNQLAYHEGCNSAGGDVLVEGRNLTIEYRWAEGRSERFAEIAAEFVRLKVDVIVTHNTPPPLAAKQATSVIPIAA